VERTRRNERTRGLRDSGPSHGRAPSQPGSSSTAKLARPGTGKPALASTSSSAPCNRLTP